MSRIQVCLTSDVPANGMKAFDVEGGLKVLIVNAGSNYYAFQAICPHQDVPLEEGFFDGCLLTCHQHLWQWDVKTGAAVGLAEAPLEFYDVKVEGEAVYIDSPSALKMAELFSGISEKTLEKISQLARTKTFEEGSALYNVGDPVEDLYVLESGRVNFVIGRDDRTSPAGFSLRKGEIFGWAALIENQPQRIASATCIEKSSLIMINGKQVLEALEADSASGFTVMRRLSSLIAKYIKSSGVE